MRCILTLHMTTDWDTIGRLKGQTDIPLNAEGRRDAIAFAPELRDLGVSRVVSSDLARARETAEIFADALHIPIAIDQRLRECAFGALEGLTRAERIARYGDSCWPERHDVYDFRPFGGECRDDVLARHVDALRTLAGEDTRPVVLLVGHFCGFRTLLTDFGQDEHLDRRMYRILEYANDVRS